VANFILLSNETGYFTSFAVRGSALDLLNKAFRKKDTLDYGNYFFNPGQKLPTYDYNIRTFQGNLLTQLNPLYQALNGKPNDQSAPVSPANMIVHC